MVSQCRAVLPGVLRAQRLALGPPISGNSVRLYSMGELTSLDDRHIYGVHRDRPKRIQAFPRPNPRVPQEHTIREPRPRLD